MTDDIIPDQISPEALGALMLRAYASGVFPMAESRDDPGLYWMEPQLRGVMPLDGFHISRSLARRLRRGGFTVSVNRDFAAVVDACAAREETWINAPLRRTYDVLHRAGYAHSLEIREDGVLAGGVLGLAMGGGFFAESMGSPRRAGSKIALACLVRHLTERGFQLMDTQYLTPHLATLGGIEITRADYLRRLDAALALRADFGPPAELSLISPAETRAG